MTTKYPKTKTQSPRTKKPQSIPLWYEVHPEMIRVILKKVKITQQNGGKKIKRCSYVILKCVFWNSHLREMRHARVRRKLGPVPGARYLWHACLGRRLTDAHTVHTHRPTGGLELVLWQELVLRRCLGHNVVGVSAHHVWRLRHSGRRNGHLKDNRQQEIRGQGPESSR